MEHFFQNIPIVLIIVGLSLLVFFCMKPREDLELVTEGANADLDNKPRHLSEEDIGKDFYLLNSTETDVGTLHSIKDNRLYFKRVKGMTFGTVEVNGLDLIPFSRFNTFREVK